MGTFAKTTQVHHYQVYFRMFRILFLITTLICCLQINAQDTPITFPGGSSQTGGQPGGSSQTGGKPDFSGGQPGGSSQTGGQPGGSSQTGGQPGGSSQVGGVRNSANGILP